MKTAKTKAAPKAEKTSRPTANAKAAAKTSSRTPAKTLAKPASGKGKIASPVEVVTSSGNPARQAADKPIVTTPREALTLPLKPDATITAPTPPPMTAQPMTAQPMTAQPMAAPPTPAATTIKPASSPATRADVPPAAGFTLRVDGHFKNQFETLAQAKQAATDLKSRFPILRIEIYDAANKARLPV